MDVKPSVPTTLLRNEIWSGLYYDGMNGDDINGCFILALCILTGEIEEHLLVQYSTTYMGWMELAGY
jgi:hypothetical protein